MRRRGRLIGAECWIARRALLVESLTKVYADGTRALDELDLQIPAAASSAGSAPTAPARRR
jgi:hypothetical protein